MSVKKKIILDETSIELPTDNWTISVLDKDDAVVQKFDNLVEAMDFAKLNGYRIHAE